MAHGLALSAQPAPTPPPGRAVFESDVARVGRFRCPVSHPLFRNSGPTNEYTVAFPRTSVWIQHEHERAFVADTTVVTMYNPTQRYERRPNDPRGDVCEWFALSPTVLRELVRTLDPRAADDAHNLLTFAWGPVGADVYLQQRRLYEYVTRDPRPDRLLVEETVVHILSAVFRSVYRGRAPRRISRTRTSENHRAIVQDVRAHLAKTCHQAQSLSAIAAHAGVSVFHLCRIFRAHTGDTLHAHLNQLRLRVSLELLLDTKKDILSLALDLGYSSHSHFTSAFSRCFGRNPSRVRAERPGMRDLGDSARR